jgi:D-lactate dehydrogenase (cytochrome)
MEGYAPLSDEVINVLVNALGSGCVIQSREKCVPFGEDAGEDKRMPQLVVEPTCPEQIQELMRLADRHCFPVTPRGLGTGLAGGAVPIFGGVVLSLAKMNRILAVDRKNLIAVVEPGVVTVDLKQAVMAEGLFYPPDPASLDTCSIGGNAATNAGGPACVKYGTTRDYVLGIDAVLASGEKISAGVRTRKGVVGYDLLHLLIGSEGTLGIITRLILRLLPLPPCTMTLAAFFPHLDTAMDTVSRVLTEGRIPSAIEFLDRKCLALVGDLLPFENAVNSGAFLLIETDGIQDLAQREIEAIGSLCMECGASEVLLAPDSQKRQRIWEIRREVALRIEDASPVYIPEDVVVPIGGIADFVSQLPALEKEFEMSIYTFGHAGDGNIHLNITADDPTRRPAVDRGIEAVLRLVISMDGTISGEHGIGMAKKRFLHFELPPESIRLQRQIKHIFDPKGILNPGKIF